MSAAEGTARPRLIVCSNCGYPLYAHCKRHLMPCCPGHCTGTKRGFSSWDQPKRAGRGDA